MTAAWFGSLGKAIGARRKIGDAWVRAGENATIGTFTQELRLTGEISDGIDVLLGAFYAAVSLGLSLAF